jgi:hypothetical protein
VNVKKTPFLLLIVGGGKEPFKSILKLNLSGKRKQTTSIPSCPTSEKKSAGEALVTFTGQGLILSPTPCHYIPQSPLTTVPFTQWSCLPFNKNCKAYKKTKNNLKRQASAPESYTAGMLELQVRNLKNLR